MEEDVQLCTRTRNRNHDLCLFTTLRVIILDRRAGKRASEIGRCLKESSGAVGWQSLPPPPRLCTSLSSMMIAQ